MLACRNYARSRTPPQRFRGPWAGDGRLTPLQPIHASNGITLATSCHVVEKENQYVGNIDGPMPPKLPAEQLEVPKSCLKNIDDKSILQERQAGFRKAFRKLISVPLQQSTHKAMAQEEDSVEISEEYLNRMQYRVLIRRDPITLAYTVHALGCESQFGYPRFVRKYGSDRFIRTTIEGVSKSFVRDCEKETQPIYWMGRKWVCMWSKVDAAKNKTHSTAVEEHGACKTTHIFFAERLCSASEECSCQNLLEPTKQLPGSESLGKVTIEEVLRSHIPERVISSCPTNCQQHFLCTGGRSANPENSLIQTCKYSKRVGLGWTNAEPTVVFEAHDIREVDDLKNKQGEVLTDGNGLISISRAKQIKDMLGLEHFPALYHGRIGPAKGTWLVHYEIPDGQIVLSRAMSKWSTDWVSCAEDDRTFEVKSYTPATPHAQMLNFQLIMVLGARGVPAQVFTELAEKHIQRLAEDTLDDASPQHGLPGYREAVDGKTKLALQMIDAGISITEPMCFKWLVHYLAGRVRLLRHGCHYECPHSWTAFIAPDWSQKLLQTECIFEKGQGEFVEGCVVVARNPCTAPWDVQVFKALGHREIRERFGQIRPPYLTQGVLVLSAHPSCTRAPASLLAGGDYDGDKAIVIAYGNIVSHVGTPGACDIDDKIVHELRNCLGQVARADVSNSPRQAIVQAYFWDMKCQHLAGKLANLWTYLADAYSVHSLVALEVGLLHQEALDGKLNAEVNGISIDDFIRTRHADTPRPLPPHWHKQALKQLQECKWVATDDDAGINMLCSRGKVRHSTSILGILFDSVRIDQLLDAWRASYGGANYAFRAIQEGNGMPPDPLLLKDQQRWSPRLPHARKVLNDFFDERAKLFQVPKDSEAEKRIILNARQRLFANCANTDDRLYNSVAFYHAQLERFNQRVREGKQAWAASKVEWQLEPAWQVCARQLCAFAASGGSLCCISMGNRSKMQYKKKPKRRLFVQSLLELPGRDDDEDAIEALTSKLISKCNLI